MNTLPYRIVETSSDENDPVDLHDSMGEKLMDDVPRAVAEYIVEMSYITLKHADAVGASDIRRNPRYD